MGGDAQLEFATADNPFSFRARLRERVRTWADCGVYFGGSSWKYAGWLGQIYSRDRYMVRGRFSVRRFARDCLTEYAETFPTVCGDFAFYQFPRPESWAQLFAQVPAAFKFGFKAPEQITAPHFSQQERYGASAGQANADFLNAELFATAFLDRLAPYRSQVGYIVLEFPQFHRPWPDFLARLDDFLGRLPVGWPLGVELRTRALIGPEYFACLRRRGVAHVFNSWTHMPAIAEQLEWPEALTAGLVIARILLKPGRTYAAAVEAFQPYDAVRDPDPAGYRAVASLVRRTRAGTPRRDAFIAVNNRFVGNAPLAISAILDELDKAG